MQKKWNLSCSIARKRVESSEMLQVLPPTSKVSNLKVSNNCLLDKAIYRLQKPVILPNIYFILKQIK